MATPTITLQDRCAAIAKDETDQHIPPLEFISENVKHVGYADKRICRIEKAINKLCDTVGSVDDGTREEAIRMLTMNDRRDRLRLLDKIKVVTRQLIEGEA